MHSGVRLLTFETPAWQGVGELALTSTCCPEAREHRGSKLLSENRLNNFSHQRLSGVWGGFMSKSQINL